jgi:hypothetical protein
MEKVETDHPHAGLRIFGKIIATIIIVVFVFIFSVQILVLGVYTTLFTQTSLTKVITDGTVYRESIAIATEQLRQQFRDDPNTPTLVEKISPLLPQIVSEAYFYTAFSSVATHFFDYATGVTSNLAVSLDTSPIRGTLSHAFLDMLKDAPACVGGQVSGEVLCRPKDVDPSMLANDPGIQKRVTDQVNAMIPDQIAVPDLVQLSDQQNVFPHIRDLYQILWRVVYLGTPVLILLLLLAALIGSSHIRGHFLLFGIGLMFPCLFMLFAALFGLGFVNGGGFQVPVSDFSPESAEHVKNIAVHVLGLPLSRILWISLSGILISLISIVFGGVIVPKMLSKRAK